MSVANIIVIVVVSEPELAELRSYQPSLVWQTSVCVLTSETYNFSVSNSTPIKEHLES